MQLPETFYDSMPRIDPRLAAHVERTALLLRDANRLGPFSSTDQIDTLTDAFMNERIQGAYGAMIKAHVREFGIMPAQAEFDHAFFSSPDYHRFVNGLSLNYLSLLNFELFGRKTIYIADPLADRLAMTELDAPGEYLRLPFHACMLVLTANSAVESFYRVLDKPALHFDSPISVICHEIPYGAGRKIVMTAFHASQSKVFATVKRELYIEDGLNLEKVLHTDWEKISDQHQNWFSVDDLTIGEALGIKETADHERKFYNEGLQFFRTLANAVLYLASSEPDIIEQVSPWRQGEQLLKDTLSHYKREKIRESLKGHSKLNATLAGTSFHPIVVTKNGETEGASAGHGHVLAKRFLVRGHWRNQPCGQGRQERKLIFIEPFYKGPDVGELVNQPYIVR